MPEMDSETHKEALNGLAQILLNEAGQAFIGELLEGEKTEAARMHLLGALDKSREEQASL